MLHLFISLLTFFTWILFSEHTYLAPEHFSLIQTATANNDSFSGSIDCSKVKCIALTFDDGPSKYTNSLLDILKKQWVKATFFVIWANIEHRESTLKREADEWHEIGNHTRNHKDLTKLTPEERKQEIETTFKKIFEVTWVSSFLIRPPYGRIDESILGEQYGKIILWNVDTDDWKSKKIDTIVANATNKIQKWDIILMHDTYQTSVDAVPEIIKKLKKDGFTFVTVDELLSDQTVNLTKKYFHGTH